METKTFETYMQENGKELLPWQKEAAKALLSVMKEQQGSATGKTFLMKNLSEFIHLYGNEFEV